MKAPWLAGIAQGQGISLLTRAYLLTNNAGFLAQAQKALVPLSTPLSEGGLASRLPDGLLFIEEYPQKTSNSHSERFFRRDLWNFGLASRSILTPDECIIKFLLEHAGREYSEMERGWMVRL
jgi:hypothetical protein